MRAGHVDAAHLGAVLRVAEDALGGQRPAVEDLLVVVDVVEERVERAHALHEAALEHRPFVGRDDARHEVERNQALGAAVLAVDRERDADAVERAIGLLALLRDAGGRRRASQSATAW